eukprot:9317887-Alexandrium_andersonii.AAC.1
MAPGERPSVMEQLSRPVAPLTATIDLSSTMSEDSIPAGQPSPASPPPSLVEIGQQYEFDRLAAEAAALRESWARAEAQAAAARAELEQA